MDKRIASFLLLLITIFTISSFVTAAKDDDLDFGIMIDAGSSGTRTFIYKWLHRAKDASSDSGPISHPITQEGWSYKVKIPLADYASKPDKVSELLDETVKFAKDKLTALFNIKKFDKIPIFLGATAGVRLMPHKERTTLFNSVREYYSKSGFLFKPHYAKVLSGEEEGFFGFLAVNYLTGNLYPAPEDEDKLTFQINEDKKNVTTLAGALDLGGASTQITFDTRGDDILENYFEYSTPEQDRYQLYTISFLQYGANQWWTRLNDKVSESAVAHDEIVPHVCLNRGMDFSWTNTDTKINVKFNGIADGNNFQQCYDLIKSQLLLDTPCLTSSCSINGAYQAPIPQDMIFYAFSGFVSVINTYGTKEQPIYSINEIEQLAKVVCPLSKDELTTKYPKADIEFLPRGCPSLIYITSMLRDAYKIAPDQQNIHAVKEVNKTEVSWALGRMIYEVNISTYERILPVHAFTFWVAILVLAIALFICLVLLLTTWRKMTKAENAARHNAEKESGLLDHSANPSDYV